MDLDDGMEDLKKLAKKCQIAAERCEFGFRDLSNLTRRFLVPFVVNLLTQSTEELVLACTFKGSQSSPEILRRHLIFHE